MSTIAIKLSCSLVVQSSHFSVKEYLTSTWLASGDVSRYHVDLEHVHTILAQTCMNVLLQPDDRVQVEQNDVEKSSPCIDRMLTDPWPCSVRLT